MKLFDIFTKKDIESGYDEKALKYRKYRIGTVSTLITVGVIVAIIVANVFLNVIVEMYPLKADLTTEQLYNLSGDTTAYLSEVDKEVELILVQEMDKVESLMQNYMGSYYKTDYLTELFKNFEKHSGKVGLDYVDPTVNPTFFTERNITVSSSSIMVDYCKDTNRHKLIGINDIIVTDDDNKSAEFDAERAVIAAIIYVTQEEIRDIHFLTGHEEDSGSYLQEFFKTNGFGVNTVTLDQTDAFSENSAALVIINPKKDFSESEILLLKAFMQNSDKISEYHLGRTLYVFLDNNAPNMPNFYKFLEEYCIVPVDEYVVDTSSKGSAYYSYTSNGTAQSIRVLNAKMVHETIGKSIAQKVVMFEQVTKSFELLEAKGDILSVEKILSTHDEAYTKPIPTDGTEVDSSYLAFNKDTDVKGEKVLGAVSTRYFWDVEEQQRYVGHVAVLGSTSMISQPFMGSPNFSNGEYVKDLINYTIGDDSIEISVMPKNLSSNVLNITSTTVYTLILAMLALVPLALGVAAVVVYVKRKHM